jgi:hypothetical protein
MISNAPISLPKRAEIEPEFEARRRRGFLRGLQGGAGEHGHRGRCLVDFFDPGEPVERNRDVGRTRNRAARKPRHAALRHDTLARFVADRERARYLFGRARQHERRGPRRRVAGPVGHRAFADCIAHAYAVVAQGLAQRGDGGVERRAHAAVPCCSAARVLR